MNDSSPIGSAIPLVDLKAQYRSLAAELNDAIGAVLTRSDFILGREVDLFETEFASYCDVKHAVGCANGTDALRLGCVALNIGPGDEVLVPAMTFIATALGVSLAGATPVLVDVDPHTGLMDPQKIETAITPRTRAIMPVHLYGQCCDMDTILAVAARHKLKVIEDAAQAQGASWNGRRAGSMGDVACFSFYPGKNLGAYGDAGCVVTNDASIDDRLRLLRNWGSRRKYHHEEIGHNSRLDTLQAAVLRVKLRYLERWNEARRSHARHYDAALRDIAGIELTQTSPESVYHLYVVRLENRDCWLEKLQKAGIGAGIHYPFAVHELGAYRHLGLAPSSFPVAEDWARRCLSLPIYPELPHDAPARVAAILRSAA